MLKALLVYCKIDVEKRIQEIKKNTKTKLEENNSETQIFDNLAEFKVDNLTQELV